MVEIVAHGIETDRDQSALVLFRVALPEFALSWEVFAPPR
jgi:hypothetical protein